MLLNCLKYGKTYDILTKEKKYMALALLGVTFAQVAIPVAVVVLVVLLIFAFAM